MAGGVAQGDEKPTDQRKVITDFLEYHCYDCHDSATQKGEREFESLNLPLKNIHDLIMAQEIIDQVTLKEMPPKKIPTSNRSIYSNPVLVDLETIPKKSLP